MVARYVTSVRVATIISLIFKKKIRIFIFNAPFEALFCRLLSLYSYKTGEASNNFKKLERDAGIENGGASAGGAGGWGRAAR